MLKNVFLKNLLILVILFGMGFPVLAQENQMGRPALNSPSSAALITYQNYPVDPATGVPNISVPLFSIKTRAGDIPFNLSYHIGNLKPSALNGPVGFGWSISPNLGISRSVNGGEDSQSTGFPVNTQLNPGTAHSNSYLLSASANQIDEQPDDFYYSLIGKSGQFIYKNGGNGFATIPFDPIRINRPNNNSFVITDVDGTAYYFGTLGATSALEYATDDQSSKISAWKLLQIVSYDHSDTVRFVYQSATSHTVPYYNIHYKVNQLVEDIGGIYGKKMTKVWATRRNYASGGVHYQSYYPYYQADFGAPAYDASADGFRELGYEDWSLISPSWNSGLPAYGYGTDYYDNNSLVTYQSTSEQRLAAIHFSSGTVLYNYQGSRLSSITLQNRNGVVLKSFGFTQSNLAKLSSSEYPESSYNYSDPNPRFELDRVDFLNNEMQGVGYKFDYTRSYDNQKVAFGTYGNYNSDLFGFYNGKLDAVVPQLSIPVTPYEVPPAPYLGNADSDPLPDGGTTSKSVNLKVGTPQEETSAAALPLGMLKHITYPTGGSVTFSFEQNSYESSGVPGKIVLGAGYRIKEIRYRTGYGLDSLVKQFKYGIGENGVGRTRYKLYAANFIATKWVRTPYNGSNYDSTVDKVTTVNAKPFLGMSFSSGAPIVYPRVTEYSFSPASQTYLGKTVYDYQIFDKADFWVQSTPLHADQRNNWKDYSLDKTTYFKSENGGYVPLKTTTNFYTDYILDSVYTGATYRAYYNSDEGQPFNGIVGNMFSRIEYPVRSAVRKLTKTVDSVFHSVPNQVLRSETSLVYDPVTYFTTKEITSQSNQQNFEKNLKYVKNRGEVGSLSVEQLNRLAAMESAHRIDALVESKVSYPSQSKTSRYEFGEFAGRIYPSAVLSAINANPLQEEVRVLAYDQKGNPSMMLDKAATPSAYIYGYQQQYPVAEFRNAAINQVQHLNFEEHTGLFEGNVVLNTTRSHTGKSSGFIGNSSSSEVISHGPRLLVNLTSSKRFTYSGWIYSDGPSTQLFLFMLRAGEQGYYSYVDNVDCHQTGKWVYVSKEVEVPGDVAQVYLRLDNNGGGNVWFDDLAIRPADAEFSTYTYEPLVGMTSMIDAKGMTSYYEYDGFQRLRFVKDHQGNIIKSYCYNYAGQGVDCNAVPLPPVVNPPTNPPTDPGGPTNPPGSNCSKFKIYIPNEVSSNLYLTYQSCSAGSAVTVALNQLQQQLELDGVSVELCIYGAYENFQFRYGQDGPAQVVNGITVTSLGACN